MSAGRAAARSQPHPRVLSSRAAQRTRAVLVQSGQAPKSKEVIGMPDNTAQSSRPPPFEVTDEWPEQRFRSRVAFYESGNEGLKDFQILEKAHATLVSCEPA